jgi:hypothetical protein
VQDSSLRLGVGEISGGIGSSQLSKKSTEGWCLEALKGGVASLHCRWVSFAEKYLVNFTGIVQEEMDGQSSLRRIREVTRVVRSCREASTLRQVLLKRKLRRNQGRRIQVSQGHWIAHEISFRGFMS